VHLLWLQSHHKVGHTSSTEILRGIASPTAIPSRSQRRRMNFGTEAPEPKEKGPVYGWLYGRVNDERRPPPCERQLRGRRDRKEVMCH